MNSRESMEVFLLLLFCSQVIHASPLFEFGVGAGDDKAEHSEDDYIISLPHDIYFAGMRYKQLHVTPFGSLGFKKQKFELVDWDGPREYDVQDPPFIAPLYFDSTFSAEQFSRQDEGIFFRAVTDPDIKANVTNIIQQSMVGAEHFNSSVVVIVTWQGLIDRKDLINGVLDNSNTFQLVVAANKYETYAMFNYKEVNPKKKFYHAGINAGNYRGWTSVLPGKEKTDLSTLPHISGFDVPGRFLFRVSSDLPERGGCTNITSELHLSVSTRFIGMFGGEMLEVTGLCLEENTTARCTFRHLSQKEEVSNGIVINKAKVRCPVPRFLFRGETTLKVQLDTIDSSMPYTVVHVVLPKLKPETVTTLNPNDWDKTDVERLRILWKPHLLSLDYKATVNINLIGYKEDRHKPQYKKLATIKKNHRLYESRLEFNPSKYSCKGSDCDYEIGLIEVELTNISKANTHVFLNSKIIPLGWYIAPTLRRKIGANWASNKCELMKNDVSYNRDWLDHLIPCPCNLDQALADFGRWLTQPSCNIFSNSKCRFHEGAVHCVKSTCPTKRAAGNQCCYRKDGSLIYSRDSHHGSTPDKAAAFGAYPYAKVNHVPQLSHWVWDVIPYYHCCLWSTSNCDVYMNLRPTKNCNSYKAPSTSVLFGDPHVITFDGKNYTMQILGMYWLLQSDDKNFLLQGDFDRSPNVASSVPKQFTSLVAVAIRSQQESNVEIRMRYPHTDEYVLDISVNNEYLHFNEENGYAQIHRQVAIIDNSRKGKQDNFTILTSSGVGVRVSVKYDMMQLVVVTPPDLKYKVNGLLGSWNDKTTDDQPQNITHWAVLNRTKSLFRHFRARDTSFVGGSLANLTIPTDAEVLCGRERFSEICKYDYAVTGNRNIAHNSKNIARLYEYLTKSQKTRNSCGHLDVDNAVIDNFNYTVGNREQAIAEMALIIGVIVGAVVLIALIIGIACFIKRRSSKKEKPISVSKEEEKQAEKMLAPEGERAEIRDMECQYSKN
ncbi:domain-containing 2-like [Octopus vulgaris]|uniref:Domain-containing 2-like n=1 Tax=Octopus vulgaris TaxID=6645 RepID=A0AA36BBY9_OCTVU|nr:domain-containing 2-like [Octopus vulgaris]